MIKKISLLLLLLFSLVAEASPPPNRVFNQLGTTQALAEAESFTSIWVDIQEYDSLVVAVSASHAVSYYLEFSPDSINIDSSVLRTYNPDKINPPQRFTIGRQYVRLRAVNDSGSDLTFLRIQVVAGNKQVFNFPRDGILPQRADATPVRVDDYFVEVALELREGTRGWRKYGFNLDVDSVAIETVWSQGGRWVRLTSAQTLNIVSTDAADDLGGTGLQTVLIIGTGEDYEYQTEQIDLNGLSIVETALTWTAVNRVEAVLAGSGMRNAGNVTFTGSVDLTVQAHVPQGSTSTEQAFYTTPKGRKFALTALFVNVRKLAGGTAPRAEIILVIHKTAANAEVERFRYQIDTSVEESQPIPFPVPLLINSTDAVEMLVSTNTDNTTVNVNFWGVELDTP